MEKSIFALKALALTTAAALPVAASGQLASQTINFDDLPASSFFGFANGSNTITPALDRFVGQGNALGFRLSVAEGDDAEPVTSAFGAFRGLDFETLLGVTPGSFTAAAFDGVTLTYDVAATVGAAATQVRLDAGGTFADALTNFDTVESPTFQTFTITLAEQSTFNAFLAQLNSASARDETEFRVSLAAGTNGEFRTNDGVFIDNVVLSNPNANAIPEPASLALLAFGATTLLGRRRSA